MHGVELYIVYIMLSRVVLFCLYRSVFSYQMYGMYSVDNSMLQGTYKIKLDERIKLSEA